LLELISLHTLHHGENSAMSFFSLCLFISRNILTCVFSDEIWITKQSLSHICQTRLKNWVIRSTGHQVNPWVIRSFILLKSHSFVFFLKKNSWSWHSYVCPSQSSHYELRSKPRSKNWRDSIKIWDSNILFINQTDHLEKLKGK
jgi:hypothetical protein